MKLYEFIGSWKIKNGTQTAYIKCNAKSEKDAKKIIKINVPFHIDLGKAKTYNYSKATGKNIILWYFDKEEKEHHDTYRGERK